MESIIEGELNQWILKVFNLIVEYHRLIDAGFEPRLGLPSSNDQIEKFERWLGHRLPPSYRMFLSLHNGWKHWEGDTHLLSIEEQQFGDYAERIKTLKQYAWEEGIRSVLDGIIIGADLYSYSAFILDTTKVDERGEMEIINWEYDEIARYKDFLDMLKKTAKNLQEIIEEESKQKKKGL